ncbi:MAG: HNH endonuclease [Chloroflexota bacterium]
MMQPPRLQALLREIVTRERHDPHDEVVRLVVRLRARDACEYCLLATNSQFQVDHIIPPALWHDYAASRLRYVPCVPGSVGPDHVDNFAWSCAFCNTAKRQQVTYRVGSRTFRLFNPRRDHWPDHFVFFHTYLLIIGLVGIGQATQQLLGFNDSRLSGPLGPRHDAVLSGTYPPSWARAWTATGNP